MTQKTVLSIGQCRPDQAAITHYLTSQFGAKVLTADLASDAWQVLKNQAIDLVLINRKLDAVLQFDIDSDEIVRRLSGRTVCESCQTPYTGREPGTPCDKCGGMLIRRKDDEPDAIRNRLSIYEKQTAPVMAWYQERGARVVTVNAIGEVADITGRALTALGR